MRPTFRLAALSAALAIGATAAAHHNPAVLYDLTRIVKVEGTVTRFNPGNPHVRIYFTRTDDPSTAGQEWMAEGGSRTVLMRRGWTPDMLQPGDTVIIEGHPAREGTNIVHMERVTLPDGRSVWAEDVPAPDKIRELMDRRSTNE
jgi:hypothetical protein